MGWALGIAIAWVVALVPAGGALARYLRRRDAAAQGRRVAARPGRGETVRPAVRDGVKNSS